MRIFNYIDLAFYVLPLYSGFSRWKSLDRTTRYFLYFVALGAATDYISLILTKLMIPNAWFVQSYHVISIPLLLVTYSLVLEGTGFQSFFKFAAIAYIPIFLVAKLTFEPLTVMDQYTYTVMSLVSLLGSLVVLFRVATTTSRDLFRVPWFWFSMGLTGWFALIIGFSVVWNWFTTLGYEEAVRIYSIHWIGNTLTNCCFAVGFLRVERI